jgi:hypothetical protein
MGHLQHPDIHPVMNFIETGRVKRLNHRKQNCMAFYRSERMKELLE